VKIALSRNLEPPELEAAFRQSGLDRDIRVVSGLMLLTIIFNVLSMNVDRGIMAGSSSLHTVWGIRSVSIVSSAVCMLLLRRSLRVSFFDACVFLWIMLFSVSIALENMTVPADYVNHVAWDVFLVLAAYTTVPLSLNRQAVAALLLTAADVVLFWRYKVTPWSVTRIDILTAFVCVNMLGIFASRQMHHWRRREFQALRKEADARTSQEKAWRELKVLQGIIPICANCKKIRADNGQWAQLEAYIRQHSEAVFSHGMCPECVRVLYPDFPGKG
jgi:hypothetical protein